jgi:hypothetical protein
MITLLADKMVRFLTAADGELARCKFDLVGVQEVRWDKGAQ